MNLLFYICFCSVYAPGVWINFSEQTSPSLENILMEIYKQCSSTPHDTFSWEFPVRKATHHAIVYKSEEELFCLQRILEDGARSSLLRVKDFEIISEDEIDKREAALELRESQRELILRKQAMEKRRQAFLQKKMSEAQKDKKKKKTKEEEIDEF